MYSRCPECGKLIGVFQVFFQKAKEAIYQEEVFQDGAEYSEHAPEKLQFLEGVLPNLSALFKALGIKNVCCQTHIGTHTDFQIKGGV